MGEIADALRRAREERAEDVHRDVPTSRPKSAVEAADDVYSASALRHEQEQPPIAETKSSALPREPSPPASPPAEPVGRTAAGVPESTDSASPSPSAPVRPDLPDDIVELTHVGDASHAPQGVLVDGGGAVTDACLQLALRVRKALLDRDARTLAVVSATRNEGKTTVSCNLALAMASLGQVGRVALVDLDLRRPSIATVLELVTPACGIEDALARGEPLTSARIHVSSPDLDVYPCLRGHPRAHELLLDPHFSELVAELRQAYDVVVFDTPPTLLVPDATIVMEHVDCFAPVARAGVSRVRNFKKILETLPRGRMLGVILDGGATSMRKGYYDHYAPDAVEAQAAAGEAEEVAHGG